MSKYVIDNETLSSIGNAIRSKTGKSDLIAPGNMPKEIESIKAGGGSSLPSEITLSEEDLGNYFFGYDRANPYLDTSTPVKVNFHRFQNGFWENPNIENADLFELNNISSEKLYVQTLFYSCTNLKRVKSSGKASLININPNIVFDASLAQRIGLGSIFLNCYSLVDANGLFTDEMALERCINSYVLGNTSGCYLSRTFSNCYALREVPTWFKKLKTTKTTTVIPNQNHYVFNECFYRCHSLDEVTDIPITFKNLSGTVTSNLFYDAFTYAGRLKRITFETPTNGASAFVMPWQNQTIDLVDTGWIKPEHEADFLKYSNITSSKKVTNANTYNQLKNDPDWYTCDASYSRFNRVSAVELFNSLPNTKSYVTSSTPNTIKLLSSAGRYTDGGSMASLTSSEIAIATSKGWTVTFQNS